MNDRTPETEGRIMGIEEARLPLGDLVLDAERSGVVTTLTRYGRPAAAIVPLSRISRGNPATYMAAVDNVSGGTWRLTVGETDVAGYEDGEPRYEWSGREVLTWDTGVPADGDVARAVAEAEDALACTGWVLAGDWDDASEGVYAHVKRS